MEKKKAGLFQRLLLFWKDEEEVQTASGGIDFWRGRKKNGAEEAGTFLAELGAVASLSQRETQQTFWKEAMKQEEDDVLVSKEKMKAWTEENSRKERRGEETGEGLFQQTFFREEEENRQQKVFWKETPTEERTERNHRPLSEAAERKKQVLQKGAEKQEKSRLEEREKTREQTMEKQLEQEIDIEGLMKQMTKRLWEERESSGRRLR